MLLPVRKFSRLMRCHYLFLHRCTFGICTLNTTKPSVNVKLTVQTSVFIRNYVAAGDYIVYGWTVIKQDGSERRHLVRIMKLNEDYSGFSQDVTVELDCPSGHSGKLRVCGRN